MNTLKYKVIPVNADVWTIKAIQTEFNLSEQSSVKLYRYVLSMSRVRSVLICEVGSLINTGLAHHIIEKDD